MDLDWILIGYGLDFDFVLGLDWIVDSKYFMDLDSRIVTNSSNARESSIVTNSSRLALDRDSRF